MRPQVVRPLLMCAVLVAAFASGCLGGADEEEDVGPISLVVYYETTAGTITESIQNNQQVSEQGVEVVFDYSYTKSSEGDISSFVYDPGDGSNPITINAADTSEISYTYLTHGMFSAAVGAIDAEGNERFENVTIRVDKEITWTDSATNDPRTMSIDATPDCECQLPEQIKIDSTVTNPSNGFGIGGSPVTVTWYLNNSEGDAAAESPPEQLADGQEGTWTHNEFAPMTGVWTLEVGLNQDQENVDVSHIVTIAYAAEESATNPFPTDESTP